MDEFQKAARGKQLRFHKVKGHADNPMNNRCDELATAAIREYRRLNGEEEAEAPQKEPAAKS